MEVAQPRSHPPAHCAAIGEDSAAGMADVTTGVASAPRLPSALRTRTPPQSPGLGRAHPPEGAR